MSDNDLINKAVDALKFSYSPYSGFCVGAALLCDGGKVYTGCNIENSAYSATVCAERTAFAKAISEGEKRFSAIAVVGGKNAEITDFCPPCGVCRQVISEFCDGSFKVLLFNGKIIKEYPLSALLPLGFGRDNLCL